MCSFKLFSICYIYLADLYRSNSISNIKILYLCQISWHCFLVYCISILGLSILTVHWQIVKLIVPVIICCYSLGFYCFSITFQDYSNAFWKLRSFWYVPVLCSLNLSGSCDCVDQVISTYYCLITFNRFLCYCVRISSLSICTVCWQIVKLIIPVIICCYSLGFYWFSIAFQDYGNAFWKLSSFWYVPVLRSFNLCGSGDGIVQIKSIYFCGIAVYFYLINLISVFGLSILTVHWQIFKLITPVISCCYSLGFYCFSITL